VGSIPTRSRHTRSAARANRLRRAIPLLAAFGALVLPAVTAAQARDSARSGVTPATPPPLLTPADTATTPEAGQSAAQRSAPPPARNAAYHPPISPKTAFFSSLLLPGLGQARLDRSYAGALFFVTEIVGAYRLRQALIDLSYAQKHSHDSTLVVQTYNQDSLGQPAFDSTGAPSPATFGYARYDSARVGARKTHVEDWEAALAFNHLISAADAFVAAQLWDLPAHIRPKMAMLDDGRMFYGATVYW
jgi:hypothetical protein